MKTTIVAVEVPVGDDGTPTFQTVVEFLAGAALAFHNMGAGLSSELLLAQAVVVRSILCDIGRQMQAGVPLEQAYQNVLGQHRATQAGGKA